MNIGLSEFFTSNVFINATLCFKYFLLLTHYLLDKPCVKPLFLKTFNTGNVIMLQRVFYSTIAALLLSTTLVQTAAAYLTTTIDAESSVTDVYDPLDFKLKLKSGPNAGADSLEYISATQYLDYRVLLDGTFKSVGYKDITGQDITYTGYAGT